MFVYLWFYVNELLTKVNNDDNPDDLRIVQDAFAKETRRKIQILLFYGGGDVNVMEVL